MVNLGQREARRAPADSWCRKGDHQKGWLGPAAAFLGAAIVAYALSCPPAKATDCTAIVGETDRLACYDAEYKAKVAPAPVVEKTPQWRAGYAINLRKMFLSSGLSIDVFSLEKEDPKNIMPDEPKRFPKLMLFGYINDPFVFQMNTQGKLVSNAASVGFKSVDFMSRGGNGHYIYDLSGPNLPTCDISRRVCF